MSFQGRRNVFEHGEDPSFKIVPLAPPKHSTPPVLGRSVCLISFSNGKAEKILKGNMDSISSPLPSVKIQIMGRKDCLRRKGKSLLGIVNKHLPADTCQQTLASRHLPADTCQQTLAGDPHQIKRETPTKSSGRPLSNQAGEPSSSVCRQVFVDNAQQ
jgi:hypothetical protein